MSSKPRTLRVTVPATSANLGAGFDVLGLALDLRNVFEITEADTTRIEINGHGEGLPRDETNLFYRAFSYLHESVGRKASPLQIRIEAHIPSGKGLGSSATAVVGGLVAANAFLSTPQSLGEFKAALHEHQVFDRGATFLQQIEQRGELFDAEGLLSYAIALEHGHHADNVAAALFGGLVVNTFDNESSQNISLCMPFPDDLKAVLLIPDFEMDTVQGRARMPEQYKKEDVIFSTGRVALLLSALNLRRYELLRVAMQDRIHQPYRVQMFPMLPTLIRIALGAGAHGACLSGGGSAVLALASGHAEHIGEAMLSSARAAGLGGTIRILEIDRKGAQAAWEEGE